MGDFSNLSICILAFTTNPKLKSTLYYRPTEDEVSCIPLKRNEEGWILINDLRLPVFDEGQTKSMGNNNQVPRCEPEIHVLVQGESLKLGVNWHVSHL